MALAANLNLEILSGRSDMVDRTARTGHGRPVIGRMNFCLHDITFFSIAQTSRAIVATSRIWRKRLAL
jgi:hypothetical protein